jgi:hypothetical protein
VDLRIDVPQQIDIGQPGAICGRQRIQDLNQGSPATGSS